jgi:alpha-N-acetylglucosamine transferase
LSPFDRFNLLTSDDLGINSLDDIFDDDEFGIFDDDSGLFDFNPAQRPDEREKINISQREHYN